MKRPVQSGGGWAAIKYALRTARRAGGLFRFYRALRRKNACKTCALGMGGQGGGMVDESGRFPEICKKSMQAMAADMQGRIRREFFATYTIDQMRGMSPRELEHMGRLAEPMFAGAGDAHYHPVSWERAIAFCVERLRATPPDESFFYFSGRSSNEAGFLLQLFARLHGTNNVNNCSYYCHQASGVALQSAVGSGTATVTLDDVAGCDLFFLIGANPASNHPRLMRMLMQLRRRGGHVIVVNPMHEVGLVNFRVPSDWRSLLFGSPIASLYVQPHIGGDIALLTGIAKAILEADAARASADPFDGRQLAVAGDPLDGHVRVAAGEFAAREFITGATDGFAAWRNSVLAHSWESLEHASGVTRMEMQRCARLYAASRATIFGWTMGITHHLHGVDNVRAISNLALLRGMVGRPHAGLLPIRGHSNVQGVGSMGVTPKLKDAVFERLQSHFGVTLPTTPGLDTLACIDAMAAGRVRNAFGLGGNLFGSNPDAARTTAAFSRLDSAVYLNTTLNTGHAWGRARETLILPVLARDEESQSTTQESMFNFVRMSDGGPPRLDGPRSEVEIVASIAEGVLGAAGPVDWRSMRVHRNLRGAIAAIIPGYAEIGRIDATRREFHVAGRTLHEPKFNTPTGRARFHVVSIPEMGPPGHPPPRAAASRPEPGNPRIGPECVSTAARAGATLRLMTIRSEGQFNTVVYEDEDLYRGQERRDVILMNPADIERLGLRPDQPVSVRGPAGVMHGVRVRSFDIRAGNAAMYYPEANVLIPRDADPESRTPAFKSVMVSVEASKAYEVTLWPASPSVIHRSLANDARTRPLSPC